LNIDEIQCFFQKAKKESETVNISILYQQKILRLSTKFSPYLYVSSFFPIFSVSRMFHAKSA